MALSRSWNLVVIGYSTLAAARLERWLSRVVIRITGPRRPPLPPNCVCCSAVAAS